MWRISAFYESFCRFFYWGWKLRNSHDFDYGYLEEIILIKLQRIEKCLKSSKVRTPNPKLLKRLAITIELARRVRNQPQYAVEVDYFLGDMREDFTLEEIADPPAENPHTGSRFQLKISKNARKWFDKAEKIEYNNRRDLYKNLEKWGQYWWD